MKTARFTAVVEASGRPDVRVLLTRPEDDKVLQTAIGRHRVMTVHQERLRGRADHGTVGFDPGPSRQYLIFPRSIAQFAGRVIVAIKYDLLVNEGPLPESSGSEKAKAGKPRLKSARAKPSSAKIVPFTKPSAPKVSGGESKGRQDSDERVRRAIQLVQEGKQQEALRVLGKLSQELRPRRRGSSNS
jgi:hypothetical protein